VDTQGWIINVKGIVERFSKSDIDKSGRNPRYTYSLTVKVQEITHENCDFQLGETLRFQAKEKQLSEGLGREVQKGDQVEIRSTGIESRPRILPVSSIRLCE
jgi:hypothetical protein